MKPTIPPEDCQPSSVSSPCWCWRRDWDRPVARPQPESRGGDHHSGVWELRPEAHRASHRPGHRHPEPVDAVNRVNVSDPTASAALTDANGKATALSATLEQAGVASADIQTTDFSIQPNFDTKGAITGYQVSNTMLVKLHNLAASGAVIDAAARSAADAVRVNGLTFSVDDTKTVDGTARADGIRVAAAHAHSMAAAAGESIGGVCSITDSTTTYPLAQDFGEPASPPEPPRRGPRSGTARHPTVDRPGHRGLQPGRQVMKRQPSHNRPMSNLSWPPSPECARRRPSPAR